MCSRRIWRSCRLKTMTYARGRFHLSFVSSSASPNVSQLLVCPRTHDDELPTTVVPAAAAAVDKIDRRSLASFGGATVDRLGSSHLNETRHLSNFRIASRVFSDRPNAPLSMKHDFELWRVEESRNSCFQTYVLSQSGSIRNRTLLVLSFIPKSKH